MRDLPVLVAIYHRLLMTTGPRYSAGSLLGCSHRCAIGGPPLPTDQPGAGSAWPRLLHQRVRSGAVRPPAAGLEPGVRTTPLPAPACPAGAGRNLSAPPP